MLIISLSRHFIFFRNTTFLRLLGQDPRPLLPKTYSDGPSDEMNARMDQDLTNFNLPVIISPEQFGYRDKTPLRGTLSPPSPDDSPPPRQQMPASRSSRARSTERRSSSRRPPRSSSAVNAGTKAPSPNAQQRRPRSSSGRRRSASSNRRAAAIDDDSASYDGSYASNGSEVIEDLEYSF